GPLRRARRAAHHRRISRRPGARARTRSRLARAPARRLPAPQRPREVRARAARARRDGSDARERDPLRARHAARGGGGGMTFRFANPMLLWLLLALPLLAMARGRVGRGAALLYPSADLLHSV